MEKSRILDSLVLRGVRLKHKGWKYLSKGIAANDSLRVLKLNYVVMSLAQFVKLAAALFKSKSIEILDFSNCWLNDNYGSIIRKIISSQSERRNEYVWSLSLRNEKPKGIEYRKGLHTLILANNKLTEKLVIEIAQTLKHDSYMLSLNLSNNNINSTGISELIEMLYDNKGLISIDVTNNPGYEKKILPMILSGLSKNAIMYKRMTEIHEFIIKNKIATEEDLELLAGHFHLYGGKRRKAISVGRYTPQKSMKNTMKKTFIKSNKYSTTVSNNLFKLKSESTKKKLPKVMQILDLYEKNKKLL